MMRTILQGAAYLLVTFLVFAGITFGISWFNAEPAPDPSTDTASADTSSANTPGETPNEPPRDSRTRPVEEPIDDPLGMTVAPEASEEDDPRILAIIDQNVVTLRKVRRQLEDYRRRDTELQLIQHDYRAEQDLVGKLHESIDARIELATREAVAAGLLQNTPSQLQQANTQFQNEQPAVAAVLAQPETPQSGLRRIAQLYERMPEEAPARIFREMARDGLEGTVALILSVMSERTMGRVLSDIAMEDAALAARLTVALGDLEETQDGEAEHDATTAPSDTSTEPAAG